jgi:hypothetical protein
MTVRTRGNSDRSQGRYLGEIVFKNRSKESLSIKVVQLDVDSDGSVA